MRTGPDISGPEDTAGSEWRIHLRDVYPPYIDWATYEKIRGMIRDNHSEYDRNKTRGVPRPGKALLHGLVYCGECGHKMVVQYKGGTQYLCNALRQQSQVPVCSGSQTRSRPRRRSSRGAGPAELDVHDGSCHALQERERVLKADGSTRRLRYKRGLAEPRRGRPGQRLWPPSWNAVVGVARVNSRRNLEIERMSNHRQLDSTRDRRALAGPRADPGVAGRPILAGAEEAMLRTWEQVRIHRTARRITAAWSGRGGRRRPLTSRSPGSALLSGGREIEETSRLRGREADEEIARCLTIVVPTAAATTVLPRSGDSPAPPRMLRDRKQSHPRQIAGFLTCRRSSEDGSPTRWISDSIHNARSRSRSTRTEAVSVPNPRDPTGCDNSGGEAQLLAF